MTPTELALNLTRTNQTEELNKLLRQHEGLLEQLSRKYPGLCKNVSAGQSAMLELLIELGFDINDRSDSKTALHHAAEANDIDRARLLIAHGADPDLLDTHIGATPWGWANHFGNSETAAYLRPLTANDEDSQK